MLNYGKFQISTLKYQSKLVLYLLKNVSKYQWINARKTYSGLVF